MRIVVSEYPQNKELFGDTWSTTASMKTLKYFLADAVKYKAIVHQLHLLRHYCSQKLRIGYL